MKSPQTKLLIRRAILLQLAAAAPVPLPLQTLREGLRLYGHPMDEAALLAELDYLGQKQHLHAKHSDISTAHHRYSLSATGRDYLEAEGLL